MPLRTIAISKADAEDAKYEMIHHPNALVQQRIIPTLWINPLSGMNGCDWINK